MTRINIVSPYQLTNSHLMAEYRELPRIFTAVKKLQEKNKSPCEIDINDKYILGAGHCKFFYNKLEWLCNRYSCIFDELMKRGFNLDTELYHSIMNDAKKIDTIWFNNYNPSPEDIYLNMARICKRSNLNNVLKEISTE